LLPGGYSSSKLPSTLGLASSLKIFERIPIMDFGSGTSSHSDIAVDVNLQDVRVGESPSTSLQPETQNFDSIFEYENYRKEIWPFLPDNIILPRAWCLRDVYHLDGVYISLSDCNLVASYTGILMK
jgi:hypothetical protein